MCTPPVSLGYLILYVRDVSASLAFYEVCGVFRLAVIAQQIYFRYHHRQTRNPAFRRFWLIAHYLEWRCRKLIRSSEARLRS